MLIQKARKKLPHLLRETIIDIDGKTIRSEDETLKSDK